MATQISEQVISKAGMIVFGWFAHHRTTELKYSSTSHDLSGVIFDSATMSDKQISSVVTGWYF